MEEETGIGISFKASSLQILLLDFSFHFSVSSAIVTILLVSGDDRRPASVLLLAENCKEAQDPYGG